MSDQLFVPADFAVPDGLTAEQFRLEPLGPRHNAADYAAWTVSIGHIQATPGFAGKSWPHQMSPADNVRDLQRHARDFAERRGFTYTVLSTGTEQVIGCVYIYPPHGETPAGGSTDDGSADGGSADGGNADGGNAGGGNAGEPQAAVSSWVRADRAALDPVLYRTVLAWLERDWPFRSIQYAPRS
jgi:hypothetical protein